MTVVGKINAYEFDQLEKQIQANAHTMCKNDRRAAAICGAALGFEIGLIIAFAMIALECMWTDAIAFPFLCTALGALVAHANQCAEKEEGEYRVNSAAYKYYQSTNGKHIIKEDCYIYDHYARLYVTAANPNGVVENFSVTDLGVAQKIGIDDITVDLSDGVAYIPYANA
jgi:hypothetical protein